MKSVFLHESGITFQSGAAAAVARAATLAARRSTMGLTRTSDGTRAESGGLQPGARASNQVPCRDAAGSVAAKGAWRAW
jgi:hypothetical protein